MRNSGIVASPVIHPQNCKTLTKLVSFNLQQHVFIQNVHFMLINYIKLYHSFDTRMPGLTQKIPVQHKMHGWAQKCPFRHSMHQLPLSFSNTHRLLWKIIFPVSFKYFLRNHDQRVPWHIIHPAPSGAGKTTPSERGHYSQHPRSAAIIPYIYIYIYIYIWARPLFPTPSERGHYSLYIYIYIWRIMAALRGCCFSNTRGSRVNDMSWHSLIMVS